MGHIRRFARDARGQRREALDTGQDAAALPIPSVSAIQGDGDVHLAASYACSKG